MSRLKTPISRAHHETVGPQLATVRSQLQTFGVDLRNGHYPQNVVDAVKDAVKAVDEVRSLLDDEFVAERTEGGEQVEKPGVYPHSPYYPV